MTTPDARLPITADDETSRPTPGPRPRRDPWQILRRLQDPQLYRAMLTPTEPDGARPPGRDHNLLRPPSEMTRTAVQHPDPDVVADYLAHSADLTLGGGLDSALTHPLAACALAEHYVFRRIGGSSAGAAAAALTAAAELGRTADALGRTEPEQAEPGSSVPPGFAGLAHLTGWLAGQDVDGGAEQNRLARMVRPARTTRAAYRSLVALLLAPARGTARGWGAVLAGLFAAPTRAARSVTLVVWAGSLLAWLGLTVAFWRAIGLGAAVSGTAAVLASLALLGAFGAAAATATVVSYLAGLRTLLADRAESEHFGLIPGVDLPDMDRSARGMSGWLDRVSGVPDPNGVPALFTWLADRIDDLAGLGRQAQAGNAFGDDDRPALTFGELWLGRTGTPSAGDLAQLRRAASDPRLRTIDLMLTAADAAQHRPYSLPLATAERAEASGAGRFLFCRSCLVAVLPVRVVSQMVLSSPAQATESACPRHEGEPLHEVPDPWDFPVVAAVRLSLSPPGLLRAVPLYTLDVEPPAVLQDDYGQPIQSSTGPAGVFVPRVQWFVDGGLTGGIAAQAFDTLLPRWPTFSIRLDDLPTSPLEDGATRLAEWVGLPEQDAAPRARSWQRLRGPASFAGALIASATSWRDTAVTDLPGFRGRIAVVRRSHAEKGSGLFPDQNAVLALALRGYHAGLSLRQRFTGPDGDVTGQTQTDRYRWIRLRMALREYREMSLDIGARLPLYSDLAGTYRVPGALSSWFTPPLPPGTVDPAWPDAAATITHLRALSAGGVLDWDTDYGAPPVEMDLRIVPEGG